MSNPLFLLLAGLAVLSKAPDNRTMPEGRRAAQSYRMVALALFGAALYLHLKG